MKTVVIGKSGQLAKAFRILNPDYIFLGRADVNVFCRNSIDSTLKSLNVRNIINSSAYTLVDKAEKEIEQAYALNFLAVRNLAEFAALNKIGLVHISSDYVFRGDSVKPIKAYERHQPINVYGLSKSAGENAVFRYPNERACVIRTSWLYSNMSTNFVTKMLALMKTQQTLKVVEDQVGTPTSVWSLARACNIALCKNLNGKTNFTDAGHCSWYEFALKIREFGIKYNILGNAAEIEPILSNKFNSLAKRPKYSVLDKSEIENKFGVVPRHWKEELEIVIKKLTKEDKEL
ncbi:dTDP-4-dehydrorhamnose reductase [Aliiglaciecola sp. M165]|uniref:dTDP-4-dehydrorhamnose reductase n=1 Tax=Aliiglaciecola sp. M165 TaxID=2593649 RepID=UPI00117FF088|nr:dTDP-4-dehydrorhamnose reductase [Aliiglaciecola sp. M165]TRY30768.1 dTDP-4-dehydrorhamnose reductase [Aliiglaciecola sp. M165]